MSKLERYLEFNWPAAHKSHASTEDAAIHVMRNLDEQLGGKDAALDRLAGLLKEAVTAFDQGGDVDANDWYDRARTELAIWGDAS